MSEKESRMHEEIAEGERWLAGQETPRPSLEAVERAKAAARKELVHMRASGGRGMFRLWHGVVAAAASIALAVGIGWYGVRTHEPDRQTLVVADTEPVIEVMDTATGEETTQLAYFEDDLSELEEWSSEESWDAGGASLFEAMNDALNEKADGSGERNGATRKKES